MSNTVDGYKGMSTLDKVIFMGDTERKVLWIIKNNPDAFTVSFMLESLKNPNFSKPNPDSGLAKSLKIVLELQERKYIKSSFVKSGNGEKQVFQLTYKGYFYLLATTPYLGFIGLIVSIVAICLSQC